MKEKERKRKDKGVVMKFIGYIPLGTPTLKESIRRINDYVSVGCEAVEISFPLYDPVGENETIVEFMRTALSACSDYESYCEAIKDVRDEHKGLEINLLVFSEVIESIGIERFSNLCNECQIGSVISPDIDSHKELKKQLEDREIRFVAPFHYDVDDDELEVCLNCKGFVYTQAFPPSWQKVKEGYDNPKQLIDYLREKGVKQPIYAGVGIKDLKDVKIVKEAGADGYFVGSSLLKLWNVPDELKKEVKKFINAGK